MEAAKLIQFDDVNSAYLPTDELIITRTYWQ